MPRTKSAISPIKAKASAVSRKQKRPLPDLTVATPSSRSSKRLKTAAESSPAGKSTATKSRYFEGQEGDDDDDDEGEDGSEAESGYEDEDASQTEASATEVEDDDDDDDEFESEGDAKKKSSQRKPNGVSKFGATALNGKSDLWREGVKTGLGPGKAVFIEKPKARGDGGIKYVPERIHPHTLEFLKDLRKNNDRVWLKAHDADYRASWKDWETFVGTLSERIPEVDETVPELPPKDLVFRIYRDVRFSSDLTPYKTHFSAAFSRTGRKGPYACYYVQIQPGKCFVGSGLWHPEAAPLASLRKDIDENPDRLRNVLTNPAIRKHIFGGIGKDAKRSIEAFCKQNQENALKTKPKGYDADHSNVHLLRLRNFTIGQKISDEDAIGPQGLQKILELITVMQPFVAYLNSIVMPDETAEAASHSSASDSGTDSEHVSGS